CSSDLGQAFVAGTDIAQFRDFAGGDDGVAYERRIDAGIGLIEALPMPTVAVVEGWAVGGGLAIATACDFRLATPGARFGVPIARTLGNTLSSLNFARLRAAWGLQPVRRMLLLAQVLDANEALAYGFLEQVCTSEALDGALQSLCARLAALAPVTQAAAKEALRRGTTQGAPDTDDLVRRCYGSADFAEGVAAFTEGRPPAWRGR
ncbi:enoyl-CoA hydratase, partial [Variovorax paradoxus]|uniref:enoyl-CoA hydratase n=1 Tax=Variovorax paradoxus TaxID=34073 RepID=UPI001ABD3C6A